MNIRVLQTSFNEPSKESGTDTASFKAIQRAIGELFPGTIVSPSLVVGATDSRHYAALSGDIYRFLPICAGIEDIPRAHGTNERISIDDFEKIVRFYRQLILNY